MSQPSIASGGHHDNVHHDNVICASSRSSDPSYFRFPVDYFRSAGAQDEPHLRFGINRILSTPEVMQHPYRKSVPTTMDVLRMDLADGHGLSPKSPACHAPLPSWCTLGPLAFPGVSFIPWTSAAAAAMEAGAVFGPINSGFICRGPRGRRFGRSHQYGRIRVTTSLNRKKPRTSFTRIQLKELEKRFYSQKYLTSPERSTVARELKMTEAQVKTWFQNRRTKWRRQTAEKREADRQVMTRELLFGFPFPGHPLEDRHPQQPEGGRRRRMKDERGGGETIGQE